MLRLLLPEGLEQATAAVNLSDRLGTPAGPLHGDLHGWPFYSWQPLLAFPPRHASCVQAFSACLVLLAARTHCRPAHGGPTMSLCRLGKLFFTHCPIGQSSDGLQSQAEILAEVLRALLAIDGMPDPSRI